MALKYCFWLYCPCREVGQSEIPKTAWASFCAPAVRVPIVWLLCPAGRAAGTDTAPGPAQLYEAYCLLAASVQLPGCCLIWCPWSMASVKKVYTVGLGSSPALGVCRVRVPSAWRRCGCGSQDLALREYTPALAPWRQEASCWSPPERGCSMQCTALPAMRWLRACPACPFRVSPASSTLTTGLSFRGFLKKTWR